MVCVVVEKKNQEKLFNNKKLVWVEADAESRDYLESYHDMI